MDSTFPLRIILAALIFPSLIVPVPKIISQRHAHASGAARVRAARRSSARRILFALFRVPFFDDIAASPIGLAEEIGQFGAALDGGEV